MTTEQETILIVDDDPDLTKMLGEFFEGLGYAVHTSFWGEEGLEMAQSLMPDLIIQDVRFPGGMDGFDVVKQLRDNVSTREIPVIFLTDKKEREFRMTGLQLGAVSYISKSTSIELDELRLRVRNVLKRVSEGSALNAITKLPEVWAVQPFLNEKLASTEWGALYLSLQGITSFKDQFGFLAADDVVRAAGVMISKTVNVQFDREDFIGHLDYADFFVLTSQQRVNELEMACATQFKQAIPFFYPESKQPGETGTLTDRLNLVMSTRVMSQGQVDSATVLCDLLRQQASGLSPE